MKMRTNYFLKNILIGMVCFVLLCTQIPSDLVINGGTSIDIQYSAQTKKEITYNETTTPSESFEYGKDTSFDKTILEQITLLEWKGPHDSFKDYLDKLESKTFSIKHKKELIMGLDDPLLLIFVKSSLYYFIQDEISLYASTLVDLGYNTIVLEVDGGSVEDIKNQILSYWNNGYTVVGIVLVGSFPTAWFHHEDDFHGPAEFPCDLFLMDMDGQWLDTDYDGMYDSHTDGNGDTAPEIYIGRINALNIPGDEIEITKKYFQKVRDYWEGNVKRQNHGLTYTDADWNTSYDIKFGMGYGYDSYDAMWYPEVGGEDYLTNRLSNTSYEFLQLACHSSSGGHGFYNGDDVSSNDIRNAQPQPLFYNLFACGALRFTDYNCLGNAYVLDTNSPSLSVVGSTKSGSMLDFRFFYEPFGEGDSFGEAFRKWFEFEYPYGSESICWFYGMTILGDPTLHLRTMYVSVDDDYNDSTPGWQKTCFNTLQDGINAVYPQGEVFVYNGTYYENIVINKTLHIISRYRDTTIIDGGGSEDGIYISADDVSITGFTIRNATYGIYVESSDHMLLTNSTISNTTIGVNIPTCSSDAFIHHNNFINNDLHAYDIFNNQWDDGNQGNYWDDYTGSDEDGNGIGDTPYSITGGTSQDRYPLTHPWHPTPVVFVDDDYTQETMGWGYNHFNRLQYAIDAVVEGGTICIKQGTYYENVIINKPVRILGEEKETTIIDGEQRDHTIYICADQVSLTELTVQNGSIITIPPSGAGIYVVSDHVTIWRTNIVSNVYGIVMDESSKHVFISENSIINNSEGGLLIDASLNHSINNNYITSNKNGIMLKDASHILLSSNIITNNSEDGIFLCEATDNSVYANTIIQNGVNGINIQSSSKNVVYNNTITHHLTSGIKIESITIISMYNTIKENSLINNPGYGLTILDASDNTLYHNTFLNNEEGNAYDDYHNTWNDEYPNGGNYWDDYEGVDDDGDGIGDSPYDIPGGYSQDEYPLMEPFVQSIPLADIFVDDDYNESTPGWGIDHFNTIQAGIDTADPYDTVLVYNGTYDEHLRVEQPLTLKGENRTSTIIQGKGFVDDSLTALFINHTSSVVISGFTITNKIYGVVIDSSTNITIKDIRFYKLFFSGIKVKSSDTITILNNEFFNNEWGISIGSFSSKCVIRGNAIYNNTGILKKKQILTLGKTGFITNRILRGNTECYNEEPGEIGLMPQFDFSGGLYLDNTTSDNHIYYNCFINNNLQAYDLGANSWDKGYPDGGNYWDNYGGEDHFHGIHQNYPGGDGIGDTPYHIYGGKNQDRYPLMNPDNL